MNISNTVADLAKKVDTIMFDNTVYAGIDKYITNAELSSIRKEIKLNTNNNIDYVIDTYPNINMTSTVRYQADTLVKFVSKEIVNHLKDSKTSYNSDRIMMRSLGFMFSQMTGINRDKMTRVEFKRELTQYMKGGDFRTSNTIVPNNIYRLLNLSVRNIQFIDKTISRGMKPSQTFINKTVKDLEKLAPKDLKAYSNSLARSLSDSFYVLNTIKSIFISLTKEYTRIIKQCIKITSKSGVHKLIHENIEEGGLDIMDENLQIILESIQGCIDVNNDLELEVDSEMSALIESATDVDRCQADFDDGLCSEEVLNESIADFKNYLVKAKDNILNKIDFKKEKMGNIMTKVKERKEIGKKMRGMKVPSDIKVKMYPVLNDKMKFIVKPSLLDKDFNTQIKLAAGVKNQENYVSEFARVIRGGIVRSMDLPVTADNYNEKAIVAAMKTKFLGKKEEVTPNVKKIANNHMGIRLAMLDLSDKYMAKAYYEKQIAGLEKRIAKKEDKRSIVNASRVVKDLFTFRIRMNSELFNILTKLELNAYAVLNDLVNKYGKKGALNESATGEEFEILEESILVFEEDNTKNLGGNDMKIYTEAVSYIKASESDPELRDAMVSLVESVTEENVDEMSALIESAIMVQEQGLPTDVLVESVVAKMKEGTDSVKNTIKKGSDKALGKVKRALSIIKEKMKGKGKVKDAASINESAEGQMMKELFGQEGLDSYVEVMTESVAELGIESVDADKLESVMSLVESSFVMMDADIDLPANLLTESVSMVDYAEYLPLLESVEDIKANLKKMKDGLGEKVKDMGGAIKGFLDKILGYIAKAGGKVKAGTINAILSVVTKIATSKMVTKAKDGGKIASALAGFVTKLQSKLDSMANDENYKGAFETAYNNIKDKVGDSKVAKSVASAIESAKNKLKKKDKGAGAEA